MWQRMTVSLTVLLLGLGGGTLALFIRGMHAEDGAVLGFCFVSVLAIAQGWIVATGIAKARRLCTNVRDACYVGAQARFRVVFLLGLCSAAGALPMASVEVNSGAQAQFATVMLGGVMFSTTSALTVLPVVIMRVLK